MAATRVAGHRVDHRALQRLNERARVEPKAAQIEQDVDDLLSRPVIRNLSAAIDLHDRDAAAREHVLAVASHAERVDRRMLDEPDFVGRLPYPLRREGLHVRPDIGQRLEAEIADQHPRRSVAHSTIMTCGAATRSL